MSDTFRKKVSKWVIMRDQEGWMESLGMKSR